MAEEETQNEETENETPEQPDAGSDPTPDAEQPDAGSDPSPEAEDEPAEAPGSDPKVDGDSDAEPLDMHPKAVRKRKRAQAPTEARPQRSAEERAEERAENRRTAAERRRRYRQGRKAKRGEPGTGTPPAERESPDRKIRQGTVVSSKGEKTTTVRIEQVTRHRRYEKVVRRTRTLHAHDESNQASDGDIVRIVETRPLSKTKRWRLVDIVERAR
jgi:small subunit ribosomal protein S17